MLMTLYLNLHKWPEPAPKIHCCVNCSWRHFTLI